MTTPDTTAGRDDLGAALPGRPRPKDYGAFQRPDPNRPGHKQWAFSGKNAKGLQRYKKDLATWTARNAAYQNTLQQGAPPSTLVPMRQRSWMTGALQRAQMGVPLDQDMLTDPDAVDPSDFDDSDAYGFDDMSGAISAEHVEGEVLGEADGAAGSTGPQATDGTAGAGLPDLDGLGLTTVQRKTLQERAAEREILRTEGPTALAKAKRHGRAAVLHEAQKDAAHERAVHANHESAAHARAEHDRKQLAHLHAELLVAERATKKDEAVLRDLHAGLRAGAHALGVGEHVLAAQNAEIEARILAMGTSLGNAELEGSDLTEGADDVGRHVQHQAHGHETVAMLRRLIAEEHAKQAHDQHLIADLHAGARALEHCLAEAEHYFDRKNGRLEAAIAQKRVADGTGKVESERDNLGKGFGGGFSGGKMYGSGAFSSKYGGGGYGSKYGSTPSYGSSYGGGYGSGAGALADQLEVERLEEERIQRERLERERMMRAGLLGTEGVAGAGPRPNLGAVDPTCPTNACGKPPPGNYAPSALGSPSPNAGLSAASHALRGDGLN